MTGYRPPLEDIRFLLHRVIGLADIAALPGYEEATPDLVDAILEEAGRFAAQELAPLNRIGDTVGARLENGTVRLPDGWQAAYDAFAAGGWNGVSCDPEFGGMGLPVVVATAVSECWHGANMAFGLCPMLSAGAIEALEQHGSPAQKALYLPKLISGQWTGTMNLTEPQAGSDLAQIRCRAEPAGEGRWRLHGQKIFITYGDHELTENIVHLVLARTPGAPAGVRGISLFVVPKYLPDADGAPGRRNDVVCTALEHKLGIHASPTCVLAFGDTEGALGEMVGVEGGGLAAMFTMMNNARLAVGLEGVAIAERARQQAADYARERRQGRTPDHDAPAPIVGHGDVRRMLMTMRATTEAARALSLYSAAQIDRARRHPDAAARARAQDTVDILIPVIKAWATDNAVLTASLGIQVHGGMGYIEETGAAQYLRDARIAPIYEGTNGIQALDLVGRKLLRDRGQAVGRLLAEIAADTDDGPLGTALRDGLAALESATAALLDGADDPHLIAACASPYLNLFALVAGGWMMLRAARAAQNAPGPIAADKQVTARFFLTQILAAAPAHLAAIRAGSADVIGIPDDRI